MASGTPEARFAIVLDDNVSESAGAASEALLELRNQVQGGEQRVREMSGALRRLRGSTEEVKSAKAQLTAMIASEKEKISAANLEMLKSGATYDKVAEQAKALAKKKEELAKNDAKRRDDMRKASEELKRNSTENAKALGDVNKAALAAAASIVAIAVAVGAVVLAFARFAFGAANAARSANLLREAAAGSRANAAALGSQVDDLARRVPTAKAALNELAVSMAKNGLQGQTLVDTFNAVGQASAALGDDAGNKLRELVDRGRLSKTFVVNPLELQGTGLHFDDIATELSKSMGVGIEKAREALFNGQVKLGDGAAALRKAVERRFGDINFRKMLDLDVIAAKLKERFDALTSKINLEPLLRGLEKMASIFDESTVTGAALQQLVGYLGTGLGVAVEKSAPIVKKFFQGMIIATLRSGIAVLTLRKQFRETFGDKKLLGNIDVFNAALTVGSVIVYSMVAALVVGAAAVAAIGAAFGFVKERVDNTIQGLKDFGKIFNPDDWAVIGLSMLEGIGRGIESGTNALIKSVKGLATKAKNAFKDALGIRSPSSVFRDEGGKPIAAGVVEGIDDGAPAVQRAADKMAPTPSGGGNARGGGLVIHVPIVINAGSAQAAKEMAADPNVRQQLTKLIEDVLVSAGVPVPG